MVAGIAENETVVVADAEAGTRIDRVLAARTALSRTRLKALILDGAVTIGGRTIVDPGYRVNAGESIVVAVPEPEAAEPEGENIPLNVVFEDDQIVVIDKPSGLVVHPAAGHQTGTLVNALIAHCGDSLSGIGGVKRPGIVHRLDKDTTGLMVVAKTDHAHQELAGQFAVEGLAGRLKLVLDLTDKESVNLFFDSLGSVLAESSLHDEAWLRHSHGLILARLHLYNNGNPKFVLEKLALDFE